MKSDLTYERYAHGELPNEIEKTDLAAIEELRRRDDDFLQAHPCADFFRDLPASRQRSPRLTLASRLNLAQKWPLASRRSLVPKRAMAAFAAVAACAALVVTLPQLPRAQPEIGLKGEPQRLVVYHKTATGIERLADGAELDDGEEIQLSYASAQRPYAAIVSVDGRGGITRHLPLTGDVPSFSEIGKSILLPYSYRLDDAPLYEDFYLIVAAKPFSVDAISRLPAESLAQALSDFPQAEDLAFVRVRIVKKGKD